jgi:hypothetical protein
MLPPELTEDEELQVAVLVSAEEEKRAFPASRTPSSSRWRHRLLREGSQLLRRRAHYLVLATPWPPRHGTRGPKPTLR